MSEPGEKVAESFPDHISYAMSAILYILSSLVDTNLGAISKPQCEACSFTRDIVIAIDQRHLTGILDLELQVLHPTREVRPVVSRKRRRGDGEFFRFTSSGVGDMLHQTSVRGKETSYKTLPKLQIITSLLLLTWSVIGHAITDHKSTHHVEPTEMVTKLDQLQDENARSILLRRLVGLLLLSQHIMRRHGLLLSLQSLLML